MWHLPVRMSSQDLRSLVLHEIHVGLANERGFSAKDKNAKGRRMRAKETVERSIVLRVEGTRITSSRTFWTSRILLEFSLGGLDLLLSLGGRGALGLNLLGHRGAREGGGRRFV